MKRHLRINRDGTKKTKQNYQWMIETKKTKQNIDMLKVYHKGEID